MFVECDYLVSHVPLALYGVVSVALSGNEALSHMKLRSFIDHYAFWMIAITVACQRGHIDIFERDTMINDLIYAAREVIGEEILNEVIM